MILALPVLVGGQYRDHPRQPLELPPMKITTTWHNANPNTVWNQLAAKLGRSPTDAEVTAEVRRILAEARAQGSRQ